VLVAPESRRTSGGEGGTTTDNEQGKFKFKLFIISAVSGCQIFGNKKQLLVLSPCLFMNLAVATCPAMLLLHHWSPA
jgi:hypothetical protein